MSNPRFSDLTGFGPENDPYEESLSTLHAQGFCVYGQYPWDHWQTSALVAGVPPELANLGRSVMREAHQHAWSEQLKSLCGWNDKGKRMIQLALRSPKTADKRWRNLLDTDGRRGRWDEKTGQWISHL